MLSCTDVNRRVVPPMLGTRRSQMISLIIVSFVFRKLKISGAYCQVQNTYIEPLGLSFGIASSSHSRVHSRNASPERLSESLP